MRIIYKWKHSCMKVHLLAILQGFALILDGLIILCTLGLYASGFTVYVSKKRAYSYIQNEKNKV